jgi:hypothetical protein
MGSIIEKDFVTCGLCCLKFERGIKFKHCSNCFACTGCEIYYCPRCDNRIVISPVRPMYYSSKPKDETMQ